MNFEYEAKQKELIDRFNEQCQKELAPVDEAVNELSSDDAAQKVKQALAGLGSLGWTFAEGEGGRGLTWVEAVAYWEAVGRACPAAMIGLDASVGLCAMAISAFGTDEQKKKYLADLLSGKITGAFAAFEQASGFFPDCISTKSFSTDGGWEINGQKPLVVNGPIADLIIVLAADDKGDLSCLLVEQNTSGFSRGSAQETMGLKGLAQGDLEFTGCVVSEDMLLGQQGAGQKQVEVLLTLSQIGFAAGCLGVSQRICEESFKYAVNAKSKGKPLFKNQDVSFRLADMRLLIDGGRLLTQYAAWKKDQGSKEVVSLAACAKMFTGDSANWIANQGVKIHSSRGFLKQSVMERLFRDAQYLDIGQDSVLELRGRIAGIELEKNG